MPVMDGFELLENLRRIPTTKTLPVVIVTALGNKADVVRGITLGADDYILKPFAPHELLARVRKRLTSQGDTAPSWGPRG